MPQYNSAGEIRAAGGIVVATGASEPKVLMVHRPAYGDWSLPKGKVKGGEDDSAAALREVLEETGLVCELSLAAGELHYRDRKRRAKVTRYWIMLPCASGRASGKEVDECAWLDVSQAATQATRSGERELLARIGRALRCVLRGGRVTVELSEYSVAHEEDWR